MSRAAIRSTYVSHRILATTLAVLIPVLYFVFASGLHPVSAFYSNYDPEFPYLLNSLEVFKGQPYFYADHPGGPLEVLGTAIYALTFPALHLDLNEFVEFHLSHPRLFLTMAHSVLLLWTVATMVYLTRFPMPDRSTKSALIGAATALVYFGVHPQAFDTLMLWSHNSFSFACGTLLLALLFRLLSSSLPNHRLPVLPLAALSLGAGLLASITIYLATWTLAYVAIVLVWHALARSSRLPAVRAVLVVVVGSLVGFFIGVAPLLHRMPAFVDWILALVTHADPYLISSESGTLIEHWISSLVGLCRQLPLLFASLFCLGLLAIGTAARRVGRLHEDPASWAMLSGTLFSSALLTALILDHPKTEYMLAVAAQVPIMAMALARLHARRLAASPSLRWFVSLVFLIAAAVGLSSALMRHSRFAALVDATEAETRRLQQAYAQQLGRGSQSLVVIWTYGTFSPCYSLWFGNDSAGNAFRREIGNMCPRQLALDYFGNTVIPRQGGRTLGDTPWDMVIGCSDAFHAPILSDLEVNESFPNMDLVCGPLSVAYRNLQSAIPE